MDYHPIPTSSEIISSNQELIWFYENNYYSYSLREIAKGFGLSLSEVEYIIFVYEDQKERNK